MIFLKENFYSDLRHSIEVDDVLGHYDIETVDIHEPLDGFNVFAKGMPTIFDKGIMYKKFYIEAENAGIKPLSMVMKVVKVNGRDVVKLSDCPEKNMCESPTYVEYVKNVFNYIPLDEWKGGLTVI